MARSPIPVRFADAIEKQLRLYAIEHDCSLSDAIRAVVARGFAAIKESANAESPRPRRRVLSRGVG